MLAWCVHYCPPPVLYNNSFKKALKTAPKGFFLFMGGEENGQREPHHLFPEPLKHRYQGMMEQTTALSLIFLCRNCKDSFSMITGKRQEAAPCYSCYHAPYYSHYGNICACYKGKKTEWKNEWVNTFRTQMINTEIMHFSFETMMVWGSWSGVCMRRILLKIMWKDFTSYHHYAGLTFYY